MKEHGQEPSKPARETTGMAPSLDMRNIWRPWMDSSSKTKDKLHAHRSRYEPYRSDLASFTGRAVQHSTQEVISSFKHPVRLYWTKAAYDYLYESGETLLRNFPVQATIQIVDDCSSSDEEDDEESDSSEGEGLSYSDNEKTENK